jgi:hypothetical protein
MLPFARPACDVAIRPPAVFASRRNVMKVAG